MANPKCIVWLGGLLVLAFILQPAKSGAGAWQQDANGIPPVHLAAEQDHQRLMNLLHITSLRRGADGDPKSPRAANYDEAKANPYPKLPDPLKLNNGKKVKTAK
ncbi:MAG: hypothetical protein WA517_09525, partial [Candidatus Acidiferrum sp.]